MYIYLVPSPTDPAGWMKRCHSLKENLRGHCTCRGHGLCFVLKSCGEKTIYSFQIWWLHRQCQGLRSVCVWNTVLTLADREKRVQGLEMRWKISQKGGKGWLPWWESEGRKANPGLCAEVCTTKKIDVFSCNVGLHCSEENGGNVAERSQVNFPSFSERGEIWILLELKRIICYFMKLCKWSQCSYYSVGDVLMV